MAEPTQHKLDVFFEDTGEPWKGGVLSYRLDSDFAVPADAFEFHVYSEDDPRALRRTFTPLRPVSLLMDGQLQLVGRIDGTADVGQGGALRVFGRDYIADTVEGHADPGLKFLKSQGIGAAILDVLAPFGITTISGEGFNTFRNIITGKAPRTKPPGRDWRDAKLDDFEANFNQGAYDLANQIAGRHGFLIKPLERRDKVALAEPEFDQNPLFTLRRGETGNVLSGRASRDWSKAPTLTVIAGRAGISESSAATSNLTAPLSSIEALASTLDYQLIKERRAPTETRIRRGQNGVADGTLYRPLYFQDKNARNQEQLERFGRRTVADRVRSTLTYECTVRGHADPQSRAIYCVDTLANVVDEVSDIAEPMWIQSRALRNDGSGPVTDLTLIRPGTWVVS